ncbi:transcriptional regulator, MerR family [Catenulispora acidiphila DSM 44928]|uniref:Transcriptional regulator, MerR family n=1 Tax=Catenulispora acidiphila (strain DSM 44928 / JCM 14897 / NBRC 102108 / NRRL B-24433 / ID139908) TaxID=479433 RepID=C7Q144_CATAD|nr:MerR family transcriptional regulator [Catenulispora acidiphila]ACU71719.1 transcriptional regulator, MerR family [Catenulispora acidiphila DSM 44928]
MSHALTIGDFSKATHLSVRTLRHYHQIGLLEPADVDPDTGYRRYAAVQIPAAQVIRRFRALDMPLDDIHAVLSAPDLRSRDQLIAAHLARMEAGLARTQQAVASLRDLLEHGPAPATIGHRIATATPAAAISAQVGVADVLEWYQGALGELRATLTAQGLRPDGPPGGMFADELFAQEYGRATVFFACHGRIRPMGRVTATTVPAADLATIVHAGPHDEIDRAYGTLAAHVADHEVAVDGPLREYYLVGSGDTADAAAWRTEIGWPVFATGTSAPA